MANVKLVLNEATAGEVELEEFRTRTFSVNSSFRRVDVWVEVPLALR